jgi:hypothetical protein
MSDKLMQVTEADLKWWLEKAPTLELTFAKTYAETSPHSYAVLGRTAGMTREDFIRAAHVIHTFGQPGKYYDSTNNYLYDPATGKKWWTMDDLLDDTDLINEADISQVYGVQNAHVTSRASRNAPIPFNNYDALATRWDTVRDASEDAKVRRTIRDHFGAYAPTTLDIGCGTGALLDMKVVSALNYSGIDPSQAMLNMLVRKYSRVHYVKNLTMDEAYARPRGEKLPKFELVVAMDVPDLNMDRLRDFAAGGLLVTSGRTGS